MRTRPVDHLRTADSVRLHEPFVVSTPRSLKRPDVFRDHSPKLRLLGRVHSSRSSNCSITASSSHGRGQLGASDDQVDDRESARVRHQRGGQMETDRGGRRWPLPQATSECQTLLREWGSYPKSDAEQHRERARGTSQPRHSTLHRRREEGAVIRMLRPGTSSRTHSLPRASAARVNLGDDAGTAGSVCCGQIVRAILR